MMTDPSIASSSAAAASAAAIFCKSSIRATLAPASASTSPPSYEETPEATEDAEVVRPAQGHALPDPESEPALVCVCGGGAVVGTHQSKHLQARHTQLIRQPNSHPPDAAPATCDAFVAADVASPDE